MQVKPIDAQKYLNKNIQTGETKINLSFKEATKLIYLREGMGGFLRGLSPSIIKNTLNAGTYYSILFYVETSLRIMGFKNESQVHFISSSFARAVQSVVSNPLVVIKTRLEVVGFNEYNGIIEGGKKILA